MGLLGPAIASTPCRILNRPSLSANRLLAG